MRSIPALMIIFSLAISTIAKSQLPPPPPPPSGSGTISKADSLANDGDIKGAIAEYKRMYLENPGDAIITYNYACVLARGSQTDSAFRYLYLAVKSNPSATPLTDPSLLNLRGDKRWIDFENYLIPLLNKTNGNTIKDIEYARSLWKLLCMDQYCFYETGIAVLKLGSDSPVVSALRRLQSMINANNLKELEALLMQKGWPRLSEVGQEAAAAAFFVLQHSNGEAQQKYISMFEQRCRENEASWQQYALMFDRMRMNQNKPQKYGTHHYLDPRAGRTDELYPLEDETRVDEWRREIGLEPLKEYLSRTGIKYVPSQTNPGGVFPAKTSGFVIPFNLNNNKTTLQARIGDSRLLRIVLDSGMGWDGMVITNPDLADSINLSNPMDASIGGAGNSGEATAVFSDSMTFTIGTKGFKDQRIVILRQGGFRGGYFDGVTGYSIFGHYTVEVNYDRSEITLYQPGELKIDKSWTEIPIYFKENMIPWIDVNIVIENEGPISISCYIDYASSESIELLMKPGQKFNMPAKTEEYYLGRGLSGDINGKKGMISKVIIGPYELTDVRAAFAPAEVRSKQKGADGVISNNLLRRFNLIFDYSNKKLFIKPNSNFSEPFN